MFRLNCLAAFLLVGALTGCQTLAPPAQGVARSVVAGRTTFIEVPTGQGQRQIVAYTAPGQTPCPECAAVAADYFKTGNLDEQICKTCGATINVGQGKILNP